jgi:signal transduction histidine kinase
MGEDADNLQCAEIWPKPEGEHAPFGRTTLTTLFTAGRGLRGRVWARSQAVWISDLKQSKDPRMPLGAEEGFRTAVTFPILIEDRALGVVELFSREVKPPDERLLAALGAMGISIGQFVARKRAEAKVQEAVKIKSEFISIVSHELRTPMTAIKEGIDLVLDGSAGPLNVDQQDFLETAKRNVDRLARLINDVLDFQRLEAGRMVFQIQPVGLETVIQETIESFQLVAEKKGLALVSRLGSLPLFRVTGTRLHKS